VRAGNVLLKCTNAVQMLYSSEAMKWRGTVLAKHTLLRWWEKTVGLDNKFLITNDNMNRAVACS